MIDVDKLVGQAVSAVRTAIQDDLEAAAAAQQEATENLGIALADLVVVRAERDAARAEVARLQELLEQQEPDRPDEEEPDQPDEPKPAAKMLVGAAVGGNADPGPLEAEAGVQLAVRRTYWQANQVAKLIATCKADIAKGRIPFPTIKFPAPWEQVAGGAADTWAKDLAAQLKALGTRVLISLHHEPNGDEPDILKWKAAQERLAPIFNAGEVELWVSYTGYPELHDPEFAFERTFPRGVKGLGVDLYQRYGTTDAGLKWTPLDDFFAKVNAFAKSRGVPWGLTETGVTDEAMAANPKALAELFAVARKHGCAVFSYFSSSLNSKGSWPLTGAKKAAFIAELKK